jgi:hypothetical protein
MLRANVGLSRKVSRNYNSDGYTVNLDAEINAPLDDPEAVLERIQELFHLAEEALAQEIVGGQVRMRVRGHEVLRALVG